MTLAICASRSSAELAKGQDFEQRMKLICAAGPLKNTVFITDRSMPIPHPSPAMAVGHTSAAWQGLLSQTVAMEDGI